MKRVIIPTDFSLAAINAAIFAFDLYKNKKVEFYLVHAYQIPYTMPEIVPVGGEMIQQELKTTLNKEVDKLKQFTKYSKLSIKPILKFGNPGVCISELVKELKADSVVLGTTGASNLKDVFFESSAFDIVEAVECPAWVIPIEARFESLRNLMFAADFIAMQNKNVLAPLVDLATDRNSFVQILNVYDTENDGDIEQEGITFFKTLQQNKIDHGYKLIHQKESVEDTLLDYVKQNETDLLILVKRHYGFIKSLFHHSVTRGMTFHADAPILVLHDNE